MPFTVHTRDSPKCILLLDSVLSSPVLCVCASLFLVSPSQLVHRRRQGQRRRPAAPRRTATRAARTPAPTPPRRPRAGSVVSKLDSSIVPAQRRRRRRLNDRLIIVPNMVRIKLIGWCVNRDLALLFGCSSSSDQSLHPQGRHRIHLASTQVHPTHAAARVLATHRDSRPAAWGDSAGGLLVALVEQEVKLVILNLWEALEHSSRKSQRGRACHPRRRARRPAGRFFYFFFGLQGRVPLTRLYESISRDGQRSYPSLKIDL